MSVYEQAETAGLGDQVQNPEWLAGWPGRQLFDAAKEVRFRVAGGVAASEYEVDAMTGATVTADAVTRLIRFWFGPDGYARFFEQIQAIPPERARMGGVGV